MLTERTCGIRSVRRRSPFGSTSRTIADSVTAVESGNVGRLAAPANRGRINHRKLLTDRELEEHRDDSTRALAAAIEKERCENHKGDPNRMPTHVDLAELELGELESALESRGTSASMPASSTAGFTAAASPIST